MRALIAGDDAAAGARVQAALARAGWNCPSAQVVPLESLAAAERTSGVDLIVLSLASGSMYSASSVIRQLRAAGRVTLLAVGPVDDPHLILRAMRDGVHEYLGEQELEAELGPTLARISGHRSPSPIPAGRVICFFSASGGSGSSTLAVNIATVLARNYQRTALFDLRLSAGDLATLLDLKPTHSLADFCQNTARMDQTMFEQLFARHESGVYLLAPPASLNRLQQVTVPGVRQALQMAAATFPFVVADLGNSLAAEQIEAVSHADVVLLVLRLEFTSLRNTHKVLEYLQQLGVSAERIRVVVNRYKQPKEIPLHKAEQVLGLRVAHFVPNDPATVTRANNKGMPVVLERPWSRVSKHLVQLATSVNGLHEQHEPRGEQWRSHDSKR